MSTAQFLYRLRRYGVAVAATLIVVFALLLTAGRWLAHTLPHYQDVVERQLSSQIGYPVRFGSLQGRWQRFVPIVDAREIRIANGKGRTLLEAGRLSMELDIWHSLATGSPVFRRLELERLDLRLQRSETGWRLQGVTADPSAADQPEGATGGALDGLLALLLQQREVLLTNALVAVELEGGKQLPPQIVNIGLQNSGEEHDLVARIALDTDRGLDLKVSARGLPGSDTFEADFYARIPELDQRFWHPFVPAGTAFPERLTLASELWGRWLGDRARRLDGKLAVAELGWQAGDPPLVKDFATDFNLELSSLDSWRVQFNRVTGTLAGEPLATEAARLRMSQAGQAMLSLDRLDLARSHRRLDRIEKIPERLRQALAELQPQGALENLSLTLQLDEERKPTDFELQADLAGVGVSPWKGAPELRGVDGLVVADLKGGRVDFESRALHLNFPKLYRQGWDFEQARGAVSWRLFDDRVEVESERLQVRAPGVTGNGRFSLSAPFGGQGTLTLMIGMDDSDGTLAPLFVPDKVVSEGLYDWLSAAIRQGRLSSGGFLYDGAFDGHSVPTAIQMFFDVDDVTLKYQPEWPAVREGRARVMVKGTELLVAVEQGRLYDGTRIHGARVRLPAHASVLSVQAHLEGSAADARRVLLEAPTREHLGEAFAQWQLEGQALTDLDLGIDLKHPERSRIRVGAELRQARYHAPDLGLEFSDLHGRLQYHETQGLSAASLVGLFFDQPVEVQIDSRQESDGLHTLVNARGRMDFERLYQWADQPILETLKGSADYRASLDICGATPDCTRLTVWSDLEGVAVALPGDLAKPPAAARSLVFRTNLGGDRQWYRVRYGSQLHTLLSVMDGRLTGGEILFNPGHQVPQPHRNGLWIRGHLPSVDPDTWVAFLGELYPEAPGGLEDGQIRFDPLLRKVALSTDRLTLGSKSYPSVEVDLTTEKNGWALAVSSPVVKGRVLLPRESGKPYEADLDYLHLSSDHMEPFDEAAPAGDGDPLARFDPSALPPARLNVADFRYEGEDYGRWALVVEPVADGVHISGIEGRIRHLDTKADLWWTRTASGDHTQAELVVTAGNLKPVLEAWGASPFMDSESAQLSGDLVWSGSPLNFDLATLDGELQLAADRGRFIDASAGGAVKLFGLLNLNAIGRRLRLDFSDVLKSGLSYDQIQGHYLVNLGVAVSQSPLIITGPTADMELEGTINLTEQTLNQRLQVTLPITDNLPLTAALLGAPQVAGAVFLVEKVIGKQLRKFTGARYLVYGKWEEPVVEPIKVDSPAPGQAPDWIKEN